MIGTVALTLILLAADAFFIAASIMFILAIKREWRERSLEWIAYLVMLSASTFGVIYFSLGLLEVLL